MFRYGAVVLFDVTRVEKAAFLKHLKDFVIDPFEEKEGFEKGQLLVKDASLERSGRGAYRAKELIQHSGSTLLSLHRMVGRVEVGEESEILWERPEMELLYVRLESEYELKESRLINPQ